MTPEQIEAQKKAQAELAKKIADLKKSEGKTFAPINPNPRFPNQLITVVRYEGIGKLQDGTTAHLFRAESKNPGRTWTPPATQFLAEHVEVNAPEKQVQDEVI